MRSAALVIAVLAGLCVAASASATAAITSWSEKRDGPSRALDVRVYLLGSLTLPTGDFGSMVSNRAGFATRGAGLGLDVTGRFRHGIEGGGLLWVDYNPTDSGELSASFNAALRRFGIQTDNIRLSATGWTSGWALGKFGVAARGADGTRPFVDLYGGAMFDRSPAVVFRSSSGSFAASPGRSWIGLAAGAGAGVRWRARLTLGLLWLTGVAQPFDAKTGYQPVSTLHATLGWTLSH